MGRKTDVLRALQKKTRWTTGYKLAIVERSRASKETDEGSDGGGGQFQYSIVTLALNRVLVLSRTALQESV
jgi:hypothetical protein